MLRAWGQRALQRGGGGMDSRVWGTVQLGVEGWQPKRFGPSKGPHNFQLLLKNMSIISIVIHEKKKDHAIFTYILCFVVP